MPRNGFKTSKKTASGSRKSSYKRRPSGAGSGERIFRSQRPNRPLTMVNRTSLSDHVVYAPRMLTTMKSTVLGHNTSGSTGAGYFYILGNSLVGPWGVGAGFSNTTNNPGGGFNSGSSTATVFTGTYTMDQLYGSYKCYGSQLKLTMQPGSSADQIYVSVVPINLSAGNEGPAIASTMPYAKSKMVASGGPPSENTVVNYCDSHTILGLTKEQYRNTPAIVNSASPGSVNAALQWAWYVQWQNMDGTTLNSTLAVSIELTAYFEFSDPVPLTA